MLNYIQMKTYEPYFMGYQLLGDSQMLRFCEKLLQMVRQKVKYRGLCVSGQKIEDLLRRVREKVCKISENVIVMIGTNDIIQNITFEIMHFKMESLVLQLIEEGATRIVLMTLPPIPKLNCQSYHWDTLTKFNEYIRSLHNGEDIFVIDAYAKFIKNIPPEKMLQELFIQNQYLNSIISRAEKAKQHNGKHCSVKDNIETKQKTALLPYLCVYNSYSDYTCDTDLFSPIIGGLINFHYFEIYFEKNEKIDLIHLNNEGLEQIKELIVNQEYIKL